MCEFCKNGKVMASHDIAYLPNGIDKSVLLTNWKGLVIKIRDENPSQPDMNVGEISKMEIRYCPLCGRNIRESEV